jgi:hypothetical protein
MIRVSTLDTLNDPFELMPYLRHRNNKEIEQYMNIRKQISGIYGLLCFSKTWEEPLLWSHYADKHKGVALGFEISNFNIFDVKYDQNPIRKQIELTNDLGTNKNLFLELAQTKYKKWDYEEESRILIKLKNCTKIDGHYFIGFGDSLKVKEIKLGTFYDNSEEYILKLSKDFGAETIRCRLERQGYKINKDGRKTGRLQKMLEQIT